MINYRGNPQSSIFNVPDYMTTPPIRGDAVQPFVWGKGGAQLTPEQLEERRAAATAQAQGDYSPIQSVWQGLARVGGNIAGALELNSLDKQVAQANAARQASVAQLLGGGGSDQSAVAAALASTDPTLQAVGKMAYERANPKPTINDTERDYAFWQSQLTPEQFQMWIANKVNPPHFSMLPNGQMGMVGGYQPPAQTAAPDVLPPDFDFGAK